jgi:cytochrome c-type biogenesis protein CcmH
VLFVVARSPGGGPPLAVKRIEAPRFPVDFELGPDDRMIQTLPFRGPLILTARLDGDGNASSRSPGDVQGSVPAPVNPGDTGVRIVLDEPL